MFYVWLLLLVLILSFGFYFWRRSQLSRQFLQRGSLQVQYRFHHLESDDRESGKSKNGALLLKISRTDQDTRNIVVKDVVLDHSCLKVTLDQLIMVTFPADSNEAYEASVRFRIRGPQRKPDFLSHHHATIKGYITSESSGRIPFSVKVGMLAGENVSI
jgi:hypothetical protein